MEKYAEKVEIRKIAVVMTSSRLAAVAAAARPYADVAFERTRSRRRLLFAARRDAVIALTWRRESGGGCAVRLRSKATPAGPAAAGPLI